MTTNKKHITDNPFATPNEVSTTGRVSEPAKWFRAPILVGCAGFASYGSVMLFTCICGHISPTALWLTVPSAAVSWLALITIRAQQTFHASMTILVAVFTTVILLKNLADTLWYGHDAIWPVGPV